MINPVKVSRLAAVVPPPAPELLGTVPRPLVVVLVKGAELLAVVGRVSRLSGHRQSVPGIPGVPRHVQRVPLLLCAYTNYIFSSSHAPLPVLQLHLQHGLALIGQQMEVLVAQPKLPLPFSANRAEPFAILGPGAVEADGTAVPLLD